MISAGRWQRIQSLFDELADVGDEERAARLASSCADDPDLKQSVEALLKSDRNDADYLVQVVGCAAESLLEQHQDRLLNTHIGPYLVTAILGHGGMSTVYRGERAAAQYRQSVAIKVLHQATMHPRLLSRLHSERHILATLDHPSIARLIDSGELPNGTPYLVMEHVDGESIDAYCDGRRLGIRARLELFVQVCSAVQFAHRNLVVHRDIKPSNILVTNEGTPKLLDFGIAKLLAPESLSHTLPVTRLQERILTPENAAPEQVLGRPITTATDIYALGVLLYRLLTGRSPYRLLSYSQLQLERAICMDDPPRASHAAAARLNGEKEADRRRVTACRATSPERLRALLAGDLDAIIAMAMRKEPDRRYASVQAMAEDINRHLQGSAVLARQGDWRYTFFKFARRHWLGVVAIAAVFLLLAVVAGVTLWQNQRIEMAREATAQERDRAQQVSAFLVEVFSQADPFNAQGREPTAKELLDRGAAKIMGNMTLQPEVRAQLLESIGIAYRRQGLSEQAIPLFEQTLAIRRQERPTDNRRIATALANLARALTEAGHLTSARDYLEQALAVARSGKEPDSIEMAEILVQFGHLELGARSQPDQAIKFFDAALAIYRHAPGNQALAMAETLTALASTATWMDDYALAERYSRQALQIFQANLSRKHPDYAVALAHLGYVLTERGKYAEAEPMLNEALEIERIVFGARDPRVAETEEHLGVLYERRGDFVRAIAATKAAVDIDTERLGPAHYVTGYDQHALANLYLKTGNLAEAESSARGALAIYAQSLPAQHLYVASTRQLLGEILLRRGALAPAEAELRSAVDISNALAGADSWYTARAQAGLGWALIARGRAAEGEPMLVAARAKLLAAVGPQHEASLLASARLAQYYRSHHREEDAARVLAVPVPH
jgi:serine/threonine protein kinase/tetratricopeptide (TPR) repeat protein